MDKKIKKQIVLMFVILFLALSTWLVIMPFVARIFLYSLGDKNNNLCLLGSQNETHFCNEYHYWEGKVVSVNLSNNTFPLSNGTYYWLTNGQVINCGMCG